MKKITYIFLILTCALTISVFAENSDITQTIDKIETIETNLNHQIVSITKSSNNIELEMEPEDKYIIKMQQPTAQTVSVFNASGRGFLRGGANLVTCPAELVRGFTYEYTSRKWYVAVGSSLLAAFGGTGARLCAGAGDIATLGAFGNVDLVEGFPDYVWQGAWVYKPPVAVPTKSTSIPAVPAVHPEKDIIPGVKSRVIKAREQENINFYESKLPESAVF